MTAKDRSRFLGKLDELVTAARRAHLPGPGLSPGSHRRESQDQVVSRQGVEEWQQLDRLTEAMFAARKEITAALKK